ncbi:MAG: hypothetical protein WAV41_06025 [Microgenomates group bacterium]
MTSKPAEESQTPFFEDKNKGPLWKKLSDSERQKLIDRDKQKFNGYLSILPEVIYYPKGDESYILHKKLFGEYFSDHSHELRINSMIKTVKRNDESIILYFGCSNARPTNEMEFIKSLIKATGHVNELLQTVGATKLISANKL